MTEHNPSMMKLVAPSATVHAPTELNNEFKESLTVVKPPTYSAQGP